MTEPFVTQVLARPAEISELSERIFDYLGAAGVETRPAHHLVLALEELLTNLGTHGNCADVPATVRVVVESDAIRGEIADTGPAFDIREAPEPVLSDDIENRPIGGLGLFLIRKLARDLDYTRRDGTNLTIFTISRDVSNG
jgi:serine/threonine-protein kinase RsbW